MTLDDLQDAIRQIGRFGPNPPKHTVLTGSLDSFVTAMEARVGQLKETGKPQSASFMGIDVFENPLMPRNRAVLKQGDEVVAVFNLD